MLQKLNEKLDLLFARVYNGNAIQSKSEEQKWPGFFTSTQLGFRLPLVD